MSRVEAFLCLIGLGLFFHGMWTLYPAAAEIAGGLFLVGAAAPSKKEGATG
jgi:hypothetical protein